MQAPVSTLRLRAMLSEAGMLLWCEHSASQDSGSSSLPLEQPAASQNCVSRSNVMGQCFQRSAGARWWST